MIRKLYKRLTEAFEQAQEGQACRLCRGTGAVANGIDGDAVDCPGCDGGQR